MSKTDDKQVELTQRKCRWCGAKYVYPKGSKRTGCPRCQLEIELND